VVRTRSSLTTWGCWDGTHGRCERASAGRGAEPPRRARNDPLAHQKIGASCLCFARGVTATPRGVR
jgi:hypothetical protein